MVRTKRSIQSSSSVTESESKSDKPDIPTNDEPLSNTKDKADVLVTKAQATTDDSSDQASNDNSSVKPALDPNTDDGGQENSANKENLAQQPTPYPINPLPFGFTKQDVDYKVLKIQSMFGELSMDEIHRMLDDCYYNEDELMLRLITQQDYLPHIRSLVDTPAARPNTTEIAHDSPSTTTSCTTAAPEPHDAPTKQVQQHALHPVTDSSPHQYHNYTHPLYHYQTPPTSSLADIQMTTPAAVSSLSPSMFVHAPTPHPTLPATPLPPPAPTRKGSNLGKKYKKRNSSASTPTPDVYDAMPSTPLPTSSVVPPEPEGKSRIRSVGRLALDDALQQIKDNPKEQTQAFEGWSSARIRAFGLIDKNPNTYYYRFNAPGEEQHKGAWTADEKSLFLKRLAEVGANSQWGIFSMALPGRVGYQCSNFYRLLIETGEIFDDNYVLDEKGKAHYLFDKKTETGEIKKAVRTHYKHKSRHTTAKEETKKRKKRPVLDDDDDDDDSDGEYTGKPGRPKSKKQLEARRARRSTAPSV